ncbi:glycoside hydrolase family 3 C-terminal domain-containing protein [Cellulomonas cellasea]|uniref:Beta-glucosidase n=1 Tax=Cellulomonas cellasea TaxID=43670 RepID=A0A7W4UH82_9CELL|nr:glycoside hydrolase family 3 C-terminal domain-containing protein [Cellulomonas cellasea]MBB2923779.1 beta-glucosidase [Cellulomonas cellasea]
MADDDLQAAPTYRDPAQPLPARARDLLARLTLDEKVALLHQHAPAVDRLGLGAFHTGAEVLHGVAWLGVATSFPQPVGLAATWDAALLTRVGEVVGTELRAKHAADPAVSLNVWAPVVNPLRHPLWGRNEEGFSEDPHLTAHLATAYARGLRGDHPVYWRTVPTLKHFLAYNNETDRALTSSQLRPRVLHEYELPAYRGPIEAGVVGAVMPSYNLVNGRPNHVARELLDELRSWTDASLMVVSDAAAPGNLVTFERYYDDHVESHAAMVRAGVDSFTDNDADARPTVERLNAALERGLLTESEVDRAVLRQLELRLATGELDPDLDPYAGVGADALDLPEHRALAREVAARAVVVLQNDGVLPLCAGASVAVVGPLADRVLHDWYSGTPPYLVGLGSALAERLGASAVRVADGADRVALRSATTGAYVRQLDAATPLTADARTATDAGAAFDVTSWGEGLVTLRGVRSGLLWSGAGWVVRADSERVGGWVAQESFRLHRHADGTWSVQHVGSGRWVRVQNDATGTLVAEAHDAADAERFTLRTLRSGHAQVAEAAAAADVVVVAVGNDPHLLGRETEDRPHLRLPDASVELWRTTHDANPRAVLAVVSSYPYALGPVADEAAAVVWSSHAGQELGHGLTDVLVGDVEPAGHLAQTWVADDSHVGDLLDYDVIDAGSTYWYARHEPLYAFGHGLSYTTVEHRGIRVVPASGAAEAGDRADTGQPGAAGPVRVGAGAHLDVEVDVANTGDRPVDELVQVYASAVDHRLPVPHRRLLGHVRVPLEPGATGTATVRVRVADLAVWDVTRGALVVEPGRYVLHAGASAADLPVSAEVDVTGDPVAPRAALAGPLRATDFDDHDGIELAERTRDAGDAVQVPRGRGSAAVTLRDVDARGATRLELAVARTAAGAAGVRVEVRDGSDAWTVAASADVPPDGGRHDWSTVEGVRGPAWDVLAGGVADLRIVLTGAARLAELTFGG